MDTQVLNSFHQGKLQGENALLRRYGAMTAAPPKDDGFAAMLHGAAMPEGKPRIDKTDKLYEQCEALETFVLKTLVNGMRKTVEKTGLINTGFAGEVYEDMLYDEYTKTFSKNADFGLAEIAYLELTGQRKGRR
ncbi:MAG: rod-binding protein [Spirochaetaceae bacterium]|jgi:flagellar protein FlgJ|nr:rod-binding protein [Spirochaetaceae bacterium]